MAGTLYAPLAAEELGQVHEGKGEKYLWIQKRTVPFAYLNSKLQISPC